MSSYPSPKYMNARPRPAQPTSVWVWNGYSEVERNRRWDAVREQAKAAGLDCIFVPIGNGLDARYLTQLRASSIVLPTDGRSPTIIADRGSTNDWVPEPRLTGRLWDGPMAEALIDAGMEQSRIGVVGLAGGSFTNGAAAEGPVNYAGLTYVMEHLPNATFIDATDIVGSVRFVKSGEEHDSLRKASAIADTGVEQVIESAVAGTDGALVYADLIERVLTLGSEYYPSSLTLDRAGEPRRRFDNPPTGLTLRDGDVLTAEINAIWGTQIAQSTQPIAVGAVPGALQALAEAHRELFDLGVSMLTPGASLAAIVASVDDFGRSRSLQAAVHLQSTGMGDDGPIITPETAASRYEQIAVEAGTAWVWRPTLAAADGTSLTWGATVIVNDAGSEPLTSRAHGIAVAV